VQSTPVRGPAAAGRHGDIGAGGLRHTLALTSTGRVLAWGFNGDGELGDGSRKNTDTPVWVKLPTGTKIAAIRAGCDHSLALTTAGRVLAWGLNEFGELGTGNKRTYTTPVAVKVPRRTRIKAISAGCDHHLALTTTDQVLAWGRGLYGQLGIGSHSLRTRPVRVHLPAKSRIGMIAAGCLHSLAVSTHGQFYGWGFNAIGQIGDGTTTERDTPVKVSLGGWVNGSPRPRVVSLFGGLGHSLALLSDGVLLAWGNNLYGQLGDGTGNNSYVAVQVAEPGGTKVAAIAAGGFNGLALSSTHQLRAPGQ